jgi:preprotein translocase subunit SecG
MGAAFLLVMIFVVIPIFLALINNHKFRMKQEEELDIIDRLKGTNRHATDWPGPN